MTDQTDKATWPSDLEDGELFRLMIESATDFAIFTIDPNGRVTSWNPGAERLLGYTSDEILGQSADVIFTPEL
jgi:PAS domain S-box-containing protein